MDNNSIDLSIYKVDSRHTGYGFPSLYEYVTGEGWDQYDGYENDKKALLSLTSVVKFQVINEYEDDHLPCFELFIWGNSGNIRLSFPYVVNKDVEVAILRGNASKLYNLLAEEMKDLGAEFVVESYDRGDIVTIGNTDLSGGSETGKVIDIRVVGDNQSYLLVDPATGEKIWNGNMTWWPPELLSGVITEDLTSDYQLPYTHRLCIIPHFQPPGRMYFALCLAPKWVIDEYGDDDPLTVELEYLARNYNVYPIGYDRNPGDENLMIYGSDLPIPPGKIHADLLNINDASLRQRYQEILDDIKGNMHSWGSEYYYDDLDYFELPHFGYSLW